MERRGKDRITLSVYLDRETYVALQQLAQDRRRTMSAQVARLIDRALIGLGYLQAHSRVVEGDRDPPRGNSGGEKWWDLDPGEY